MKPLQSHTKLIEIQTRLSKQSYLSKGNLPGSADAKMFLFLEQIKRYPDRKSYPNFYHWYILMKQFALNSIQKWIVNRDEYQEDEQIIADFITVKQSQKVLTQLPAFKKNQTPNEQTTDEQGKILKPEELTSAVGHEIEYIMDVKMKEGIQFNMRELITNFLSKEQQNIQSNNDRIEFPDIQQLLEERRVRIVAKMDLQRFEQLKNKISALEGVQTFESKKKDKRFKTVNSAANFITQA